MKKLLYWLCCFMCLVLNTHIVLADSGYYVLVGSQQVGPNSMDQLQKMEQTGQLTKNTLVWKEGMAGWENANTQASLLTLFSATTPPSPPTPPVVVASPPPLPEKVVPQVESDISQVEVSEQNEMSTPRTITSATDSIDDWADETIISFGREAGEFGEKKGKFILFASQAVALKPIDPQYGDALVNAFDKAMIELQEQYVMTRFGKILVDKAKSFYSDRSTNAKELELPAPGDPKFVNKFLAVFEKSLDVADKKLDKELLAMGEDPGKLQSITPKIKKDFYREKFLKTTMRKASGSISGLFPLQTAVISDKKGKTMVGVIAIASPKTIQVAKDIKLQRNSLVKGKGRDISSLLPQSNKDYLHTMGTRLTYDKDGTPAILAYGISSYRPDSDDDYINDQLKSEAKSDAISNADAQIAEIINGHMNVNNERKRGEEIRKYVEREVKVDSDTIEKNIKNIIKITNNSVKSSASAQLQGISSLKNWRYTADTGQKYVGSVRVWKYSTLQAIKDFNNSKYSNKPKKQTFKESIRYSQPVNSVDDF